VSNPARPSSLNVTWADAEPGWADALREMRCARRHSCQRWPLVLLITSLLTGLLTFRVSQRQRSFQSTIVMRVFEQSFDPDTLPATSSQLEQYITDVSLSRHALLAVIGEFGLYGKQLKLDANLAVETMREAIEIDVVENYFAPSGTGEDPARSARIAVNYSAADPELALRVVRYLGRVIENKQQVERQTTAIAAARRASSGVELLRFELLRLQRRQADLRFRHQVGEESMAAEVEAQRIRASILRIDGDMGIYEAKATEFQLRSDFEEQARGLRFQLVDSGQIAEVTLTDNQRIVFYACCAFLFFLPLVGLAIGSFDSRVRDGDGLRRIGLFALGEVPRFEGMECGAWAAREAARRGGI